jgi:hypothetical protein
MKTALIILLSGLFLCGCSQKQATNDYPKNSWAFAGYASPDSALESWIWAFSKGDKAVMLQSLTTESQQVWETHLTGETDAQMQAQAAKAMAGVFGYTIQKRKINSDDDVIISLTMNGIGQAMKMELKKIGNDWKVAGPKND